MPARGGSSRQLPAEGAQAGRSMYVHALLGTLKRNERLFPRYEPVVKVRVQGCVGAVGMAETQPFTVIRGPCTY